MTLVRARLRAAPSLSGSHAWLHGINSVVMRQLTQDLFFHGVYLTLTDPQLERAAHLRDHVVEALAESPKRYLPAGGAHCELVAHTRQPYVGEVDNRPETIIAEAARVAAQQGPPNTVVLGPPRAHQGAPTGHPDVQGWLGSITGVVEFYASSVGHAAGTCLVLPIPHNPPVACRPSLDRFVRDLTRMVQRTPLRLHVAWYPGDLVGDARDPRTASRHILSAVIRSSGLHFGADAVAPSVIPGARSFAPSGDSTNPFRRLLHRTAPTAPSVDEPDLPVVHGYDAPVTSPRGTRGDANANL